MKIGKDSITELNLKDKEIIWDAWMHFVRYCSKMGKSNHIAAETFKDNEEYMYTFLDEAYIAWERRYH